MTNEDKYIVVKGDVLSGFRFFGVFNTHEEAFEWGLRNIDDARFSVSKLFIENSEETWKHNAPYNAEFLGAQQPKANQDY